MQPNEVLIWARVGEAAERRHNPRPSLRLRLHEIEAVCPLSTVRRTAETSYVALPAFVIGLEVTTETEPNIEVRVFEKGSLKRFARQVPDRLGERELEIEEVLCEGHALLTSSVGRPTDRALSCVAQSADARRGSQG